MIVERLRETIKKGLTALYGRGEAESSDIAEAVKFEHPKDLNHGDYSTNVALVTAKTVRQEPRAVAEQIVRYIVLQKPQGVERVEAAGAGFINFFLSRDFFADATAESIRSPDTFGRNGSLAGKKIMVEYTDPNPFKEFHIGHLMSNAIGESIARLLEFQGATVRRACWQGDVGLHVAKAIWAVQGRTFLGNSRFDLNTPAFWGEAYAKGSAAYETDESVKKEIEELNRKIFEKSDAEVNALYEAGRNASLEHFEEIYKKLGTKFDHYFFEGTEGRLGKPIVEEYLGRGVFEKSEGAIIYRGDKHGLHTRVFINSQGLPTYEAKELGLNKRKFELEPDLAQSIVVTANEQSDYFKVVLAAMAEVMPEIAKRTKHLAHGMLRFASGKMSSRKGNVITGESLLERVKELVREKIKDREMPEAERARVAEAVAAGAIKYSILRQAVGGDIIFDFDRSISFEGDSGPYLQYSYVRAKSVLAKAESLKVQPWGGEKVELWKTTEIERLLYRFPEVVERAAREYQPHHVATFLIELAGAFNSWYAKEQIVNPADPASPYKVALTDAFAAVMKNGLWTLGIQAPERM